MRLRSAWPAFCLLLLSLFLASGCRPVPVIKIGLVAPFEGRNRPLGYDSIYAARLAIREINAAGGVGGHRLALVALDDSGDIQLARDAAASLALDPAVVAVVGHGLPETTAAGRDIYQAAGMPLVALGAEPFEAYDPAGLPADFLKAYAELTPFDEKAGHYGGVTYDAFFLIVEALRLAESQGDMTRESVATALEGLEYEGLTGRVHSP